MLLGRYAILANLVASGVHFSWQLPCVAADDSPPLVRGVGDDAIHGKRRTLLRRHENHGHHRRYLQIDCTSTEYQKNKNTCPSPDCSWQQGGCVPALTSPLPPSASPSESPVPPATPPPTNAPLQAGAGYCSDDASQSCFSMDECACAAVFSASAYLDTRYMNNVGYSNDRRRELQDSPDCADKKKQECPSGCTWVGGSCVQEASPPTGAPTFEPTKSPTPCACLGLPSLSPTKSPTRQPSSSPAVSPSSAPSSSPTKSPSSVPTDQPTTPPSTSPSSTPSKSPVQAPVSASPTTSPTASPSEISTASPTNPPTSEPSSSPSKVPSSQPTLKPATESPTSSPSKSPVTPAPTTLTNQIICGYQGWFTFPGDGAPINRWKHWYKNPANESAPTIDELTIDMYPTTDEYDDSDLKEVDTLLMNDGSKAKFYSNAKPNVVLKHFEWMRDYGITGVFHMRFMQDINLIKNRDWKTMVLRNVKAAAEATGRAFAVSYNVAGNNLNDGVLDDLKVDWMRLVDEELITQSSRYINQNGLPVLRIYGIGFKTVNVSNTTKVLELIDWFQNTAEEKYRVFLIGGVPSRWRDRINDSREEFQWKEVYDSFDGLHPWHVGRWETLDGFNNFYSNHIFEDADYCAQPEKDILYMPTMWPGFSWHNLKNGANPVNQIPRLGGDFMWRQAYFYTANPNIGTIWMAQFDEVDEGTAILKVAPRSVDLPAEGNWLALDVDGQTLPSDWYLQLAGVAQKMLEGDIAVTDAIPIQPDVFER